MEPDIPVWPEQSSSPRRAPLPSYTPYQGLPVLSRAPESSSSSGSSSSSDAGTSAPPRRRAVSTEYQPRTGLGSCAACRFRRVKCVREGGAEICVPCGKKGLNCFVSPKGATDERTVVKRARMELSPSSTSYQLTETQLQGHLVSSVLDLFFQMPERLTILRSLNILDDFEAASRRLDRLTPESSTLVTVIAAIAARVSDHPMLAGTQAPTLDQLGNAQDLSRHGRHRQPACEALLQKAIKDIDQNGIMKTASMSSLACLFLLEGLIPTEASSEMRATSQAYAAAAIAHTRVLIEDEDTPEGIRAVLGNGEIGWGLFSRDCFLAAERAFGSLMTDDDVDRLVGGETLPITEVLRPTFAAGLSPSEAFLASFRSAFKHLALSARKGAHALCGYKAMKSPRVDEAALKELVVALNQVSAAIPVIEAAATAWVGPATNQSKHFTTDRNVMIWSVAHAVKLAHAHQQMMPYRIISSRIEGLSGGSLATSPMGPTLSHIVNAQSKVTADSADLQRLHVLLEEVTGWAFQGVKEMVLQLEMLHQTGFPLVLLTATNEMFGQLKEWAAPLINTRATEEGGPEGFGFKEKIAALSSIANAVAVAAWSYAVDEDHRWLLAQVEKVKQQAAEHALKLSVQASPPTPAFASLLQSTVTDAALSGLMAAPMPSTFTTLDNSGGIPPSFTSFA